MIPGFRENFETSESDDRIENRDADFDKRIDFDDFDNFDDTDSDESKAEGLDDRSDAESDLEFDDVERSSDEINKSQKEEIDKTFEKLSNGEKLDNAEKGNLGEMLMDQHYIREGYTPIHSPRVENLDQKGHHGLDGVYEKTDENGEPQYVIADAKVNYADLEQHLADGTDQMSDEWIFDHGRLDNSVGKEKADEIRDAYEDDPSCVTREVYHVETPDHPENPDGVFRSDVCTVDADGHKNPDRTEAEKYDQDGNVII